jgi:hypothetical protein
MLEIMEIMLAGACWAIALLIYFYIMPIMRDHQPWHVMGLNFFGAFAGYLGFEVVADTNWLDGHYGFYLMGNSMFPIAAALVIFGYWRKSRA